MIHPDIPEGENAAKKKVFDSAAYKTWSAEELTGHLKANGVPVGDNLITHKISGDVLDDLTEDDYNNLGYEFVGDKIRVWQALIDLQNEKRKYRSYGGYWQHRWEISNLRKYYQGEDLTLEEADNMINSFALINALIITIPFSVLTGIGSEYWTALRQITYDVVKKDCPERTYDKARFDQIQTLYACAYASMSTLVICIFYYMLRPKFVYFKEWWRRGKYCVLLVFLGSTVSIVMMLTLFGLLAGWFAYEPSEFCENLDDNNRYYNTGVAFIVAIAILSIVLMA